MTRLLAEIDFGIKVAFLAANYVNWAFSTILIDQFVFNSLNLNNYQWNISFTYLKAYFIEAVTIDCIIDFDFTFFQSDCSESNNHLVFDFLANYIKDFYINQLINKQNYLLLISLHLVSVF